MIIMDMIEILNTIRRFFELNQYEAKALIAIYRGAKDYKEISEIGEIPMPRVYDIVRGLMKKGLVTFDRNGFRAIDPEVLVSKRIAEIKAEFETELARAKSMASEVSNILRNLRIKEPKVEDFEEIAILDTIEQILTFFTKAIYDSTEIIMLIRKAIKFRNIFISALDEIGEGKTVKVIVPNTIILSDKERELVERYNIKIKYSRFVPHDMMVTSSGYIFLGFPYRTDYESDKPLVVVIKNKVVAKAALNELSSFFNELD